MAQGKLLSFIQDFQTKTSELLENIKNMLSRY